MRGFDDFRIRQKALEGLGVPSPKDGDERQGPAAFVMTRIQSLDRLFGDFLPTFALMTVRRTGAYGQGPVQKHDPLNDPRCQVAVGGTGKPQVIHHLLIDVPQAGGNGIDVRGDAKTQSHWMTGRGIGVLPHDEDFHLVKRELEGAEDIVARRQGGVVGSVFRAQKIPHATDISLHRFQGGGPGGVHDF